MTSLAEEIGQTLSSLELGTRVGLMSSMHDRHALEGRDWHGLHKGFAAGGVMVDRLHLPCYHEISKKNYYLEFNRYPFHCRALLPRGTVVYPELENGSFGTYTKEARFLRFQLESALPLCIEGMTYDIYDFVGNGVIESFGYGEAVKEITPYLNGVMQLRLRYEQLSGVVLPIDEKTAYKRNVPVHGFSDLVPDETAFNAYLTSVGVSCTVSTKKRFRGQIVALGGGNAYNFTKKQLRDLFAENFVVLEGGAARILIDRGLGELFGAVGYQTYVGEHNIQSYEEVKPPMEIHGKKGYRATAFGKARDYVKIDYIDEDGVQSFVYDYLGNKIGAGATCVRGCFVIPYVVDGLKYEQYNDLRTSLLRAFLRQTGVRLVCSVHAGVYVYLYEQRGRRIVLVVNSTEENFEELEIELWGFPFTSVQVVDRTDGRLTSAPFRFDGNKLCVACKNEHLTTSTIVLK